MEKFTGIKQFDFQILRFTERFKDLDSVKRDLTEIGNTVHDFQTWTAWWSEKAKEYENEGLFDVAARYYRASFFYIFGYTSQKEYLYNKFIENFYRSYNDFEYEKHYIPYETSELPSLFLKNENATKTLVIINGFDGILEELADFVVHMKNTSYNIIIFDGPGQGLTYKDRLTLIPNYELVLSKVLDYYKLIEVDILGLSLGGYFALRSAAFEKRIKRVIAMDIFYYSLDAFKLSVGNFPYFFFRILLKLKAKNLINTIISLSTKLSLSIAWQVYNAMQVSGQNSYYNMITELDKYNIKDCLSLINQDCLLLVAKEDMYVPFRRLFDIKKGLKNSKSVKDIIFTKESGGELHCHVGNMKLAFTYIKDFLF